MIIPFGAWKPDEADFGSPNSTVAKNVIPLATNDYGPLPGISVFSDAITARAQGAIGAQDKDGNVFNFSGDASKLYQMSAGLWTDISRTAGYTTAADDAVEFIKYKEKIITANGLTDPLQSYTMGTSSLFQDLTTSNSAPSARHIAVIDPDFVMVGNTTDANDGAVPYRVWWSAFADPTDWPVPGSADAEAKQSDFTDLANGGWVQRITGAIGGASGAVFMEHSVYRVDYEGPPTVFRFTEIEKARGTPAPNSVINLGPFGAYLGEDGFYMFDGSQSVPIGAGQVDRTFFADLNQSFYTRVWGAADPINKQFYWVYPGGSSTNGVPDKTIVYNWHTKKWSFGEFNSEMIYSSFGTGYTLETLDNLGFNLDTLPASLDSRAWSGGRPNLSVFNDSHQLGYFSGDNLEATIETGEFPQSDRVVYVDGIRPLVDGGTPTVEIGHRATQDSGVTYTNPSTVGADNVAPQRIAARYLRTRVKVPAASSWEHAIGIEPILKPTGRR